MLWTGDINVKSLSFLLIDCRFKHCELWHEKEYLLTHSKTKEWKSHLIASRKIELLQKQGLPYKKAQMLVILEGNQKINKKNLSLLGTPIYCGTVEELTTRCELWGKKVCNCYITGIFRNRLIIILEDGDTDA